MDEALQKGRLLAKLIAEGPPHPVRWRKKRAVKELIEDAVGHSTQNYIAKRMVEEALRAHYQVGVRIKAHVRVRRKTSSGTLKAYKIILSMHYVLRPEQATIVVKVAEC